MSISEEKNNWENWKLVKPINEQGWSYQTCPACKHKEQTLLAHCESGHFFCENCSNIGNVNEDPHRLKGRKNKTTLPFELEWWKKDEEQLPLNKIAGWFKKESISIEMVKEYNISVTKTFFPKTGKKHYALALPCYETGQDLPTDVLYLAINPKGGYTNGMKKMIHGSGIPWGWNSVDMEEVIIVNHPLDRLALLSVGKESVVCFPDNLDVRNPDSHKKSTWDFLQIIESDIINTKKIIFAFDDSEESIILENELGRRFGKEKCFRTRWNDPLSDPNKNPSAIEIYKEYGEENGAESIEQSIEDASPFPVTGIYELKDVEDRFEALYEFGLQPGLSTGWPSVDPFYTVVPGQWTLITGMPGSGKSSWLDGLLIQLADLHDWNIGVFSPENQPIERYYAGLIEKASGKAFNQTQGREKLTIAEKDKWKYWVNRHFKYILPDEEESNWSLEGILSLAKVLVYRYGIKALVIDPWNEIEHNRSGGLSETDYISAALTKVRRFAKNFGVHVFIVAHPTKMLPNADGVYPVPTPYNVAGGAHWRNKADNAITIYRNIGEADEDITDVYVQKIRFKEVGRVGMTSLRAEKLTGKYIDDVNHERRKSFLQDGKYMPSTEQREKRREYSKANKKGLVLEEAQSPDKMFDI